MHASYVRSGRASLAVTTWGDDGPAILALHPGVGDSRSWEWCAPTWVASGHRVVAFDRRGFGATETEPEDHDDLSDLMAVVEATGARPAVVVGNSRGGGLALEYALENPDQVRALVLISPSPTGYDKDWPTMAAEAELDELITAAEAADDLDLVNRLEIRYWLDGVDQPPGRVGGEPRRLMAEMNSRALTAAPIGSRAEHPPSWPQLPRLEISTLVVSGEHDLDGYRRMCDEIAEVVPAARRATIPGSAHCPQLDQPEALSNVLLDFIDSLGC